MDCKGCPYNGTIKLKETPIRKSKIMLIGESPGMNELKKQKPFIGKSGKLLRDNLNKVDLDDENIFITNAILCRPQNSNVERGAIRKCRKRLFKEIESVNPTYIITLGAIALKSLMDDFSIKITKISGNITKMGSRCIMPTIHPALVLRNPGSYSTFYSDLKYFSDVINGKVKSRKPGKTEFKVLNRMKDAKKVVDKLLKDYHIMSADIETGGLHRDAPILCLGISPKKNFSYIFTPETINLVRPLFASSKIKFIWHNGQFDTFMLRQNGSKNAKVAQDTMLLHYCLDENTGGHKLNTLAMRYLGADNYDEEILKYKDKDDGYLNAPKNLLYKYLAKDCDYTRQIYNKIFPKVNSDIGLRWLYNNILIPGANFSSRVKDKGMYIDTEYLDKFNVELDTKIKQQKNKILKHCQPIWDKDLYLSQMNMKSAPDTFNPLSSYQLQWMIHYRMKLKPSYKKGDSAGKEVLESCKDQHPVVSEILKYKSYQKVRSTYVKGVKKKLDTDNRIRTNLNLHTTVTGRLSSTKPNLQNIKRDPKVKNIFSSPKDRLLMEADFKAAELRILAMMSEDPKLIQIFNEGRDLHSEVARENFGSNFTKEERVQAKSVNFGIIYGITNKGLSRNLSISFSKAQKLIDNWYNQFPVAKEYLEEQDRKLEQGKIFVTPLGRKRRYGAIDISDEKKLKHLKNEARNFTIQSVASDFTLISAMRLEYRIIELYAFIVNLVHDSIIIELPSENYIITEVKKKVKEIMENTPNLLLHTKIPFPVDIAIGNSWGSLKQSN